MPLQSRSALFQIHFNPPYKTETDFTKKRCNLQCKTFGLSFSCNFSEISNKLTSCTFKATDLFQVVICINGNYFWVTQGDVLYAYEAPHFGRYMEIRIACFLKSIVSYIHYVTQQIHLINGFSFDEASYSEIFWMWLERHFSL